MPGYDKSGPQGQGSMTGRGAGQCNAGSGQRAGRGFSGRCRRSGGGGLRGRSMGRQQGGFNRGGQGAGRLSPQQNEEGALQPESVQAEQSLANT